MLTKFEIVLGISISVIIISALLYSNSVYAPIGGRPITGILTDNGYVFPNNNGIINMKGLGLTKVLDPANNTVTVSTTSLYSIGLVERIIYNPNDQIRYIDDQFEQQSQYTDDITHFEQYSGVVGNVLIKPFINTMDAPLTFELFLNGQDTGKGITIQPNNYTEINTYMNQTFNKGDNLLWHIISEDTQSNSLGINAQAIVIYNFTGH